MSTGKIFIELDKPYYYVGDTVTGHINVNLYKDFKGAKMTLKLKGWESSYWIVQQRVHDTPENPFTPPRDELMDKSDCEVTSDSTDSSDVKEKPKKGYIKKGQNYYKIIHYAGGKQFMKLKQKMSQFGEGHINSGQHRIPFSFALSSGWPGSFTYKTKTTKGRIKYEMRVKCKLSDKKDREFEHKVEVMVHEKPTIQMKSQNKTMEAKVVSCCCFSKGTSKITLGFQKDQYAIGEDATLFCEIDNTQCEAKVNSIIGSLVNTITLRDKNGAVQNFAQVISSINFGDCEPQSGFMGDQRKIQNLKIDNTKGSWKKMINPTTSGKFVNSTYYIAAESNMDTTCSCCCGSDPRVSIPVLIIPPPFQQQTFEPPQDWQPQQYPVFNIPLPPQQYTDYNIQNPMQAGNMNQIQPSNPMYQAPQMNQQQQQQQQYQAPPQPPM